MAYFREHWKPKAQCSSPSALSGIVDRNGMGNIGKLPNEQVIIEVFRHIPFRQRLKTTLLVSKSFQGLIHEKSLWQTVEVDRALVGPTLAYMIQPTPLGGCWSVESLIPKGNIKELSIDMSYCTTGSVIGIIKRLQLQKHTLTSLSVIGAWPLLNSIAAHLCKQIRKNQISLAQIVDFSLTGGNESAFHLSPDEVGELLALMPNLLHVRIEGKRYQEVSYLKVDENTLEEFSNPSTNTILAPDADHSPLKTLIVPFWVMSLSAMVRLGNLFPELEMIELGMTASREDTDTNVFSSLLMLRSAKITYHADSKEQNVGVNEEQISKYFINLVANAPRLRELSFSNESYAFSRRDLDLFKCAKYLYRGNSKGVESLDLQNIILKGWAPIGSRRAEGMKRFWRCPNLLDAPWLWVDVERRQRHRVRKPIKQKQLSK